MELNHQELQRMFLAHKRRRKLRVLWYAFLSCCGILLFLLFWQYLATSGLVNPKYLASPVKTWETLLYKLTNRAPDGNTLLSNIWASMEVALLGFVLATGIGIPLGLCMGWFEPVDRFVTPVFELVRPIPPIAWIPVIVVLCGINIQARAIIIFLATFVSCVLNAYTGIKLTNRTLINVSKTFGAGNFETFWKVGVPAAMPMVFTGIRLSLGGAWMTLVAAEMLASNSGLGNMLSAGRKLARPDIVILGMAVIGFIGFILISGLAVVERHVLRWKAGN